MKEIMVERLRESLPVIFSRTEIDKLTGGALKSRTLANWQSQGRGPDFVRDGKRVIYEKQSFIEWYAARLQDADGKAA